MTRIVHTRLSREELGQLAGASFRDFRSRSVEDPALREAILTVLRSCLPE